ncbi:uncharacterized protein LOC114760203 [Neltuma alba]|uniref:uncharacterized protein LOC114760203 n=1 Tax=Neltuma alba TaxID=207710 RepID=UPI0010A4992E|nr:uncharacterized protein LOC114760203 [Prosopis alba]
MANTNCVFRAYVHSFDELQPLRGGAGQIAVVFAKDRGGNGNFQLDFNVIAQQIHDFKSENENFKFFLSMEVIPSISHGLTSPKPSTASQTSSTRYRFDGIDVYYDQIPVPPAQFVDVMQSVIVGLRERNRRPSLEVSLTVPHPLGQKYYLPLYNRVQDLIEYVIYQIHSTPNPVNDVGQLVRIFDDLPYPAIKLFAGFITDCNIIPLLVFIVACIVLFIRGRITGVSVSAASVV